MGSKLDDREVYWRRKLRRLRFEAEPIEEQLARQYRATWVLTLIPGGIGLMFLAIFGAFGRWDVGMGVAAVLIGPMVAWAWLDYAMLRSWATAYLKERAAHKPADDPPG